MKIKIALIILTFTFSDYLIGQFAVTISGSKIKTCKDTVITFTATATNGGIPVPDATFEWSFGDNSSKISGLMLDTVTHSFSKDGGYIIRVDAASGANKDYALLKVEIALKPFFTGTKSDRDEPICLGQQIFLTGKSSPKTWKYITTDSKIESFPALVSNTSTYNSEFDKRIYNKSQIVTSAADIDTIGLKLEHSNLADLKIELICPEGNSIILKDFGGFDKYLGEPVDNESSNLSGVGYNYYWINIPTYGTMNSVNPVGTTMPSGSYTPEQPFSNLTGCSLNGSWKIKVTDNQSLDNGFIFASQLKLNESLILSDWEYSNSYSSPLWLGSGVSSTSGTGLATAIPIVHGNHRYTFRVKDNYNCFQDTSLINSVEAVTFTTNPSPPEGEFDLDIEYTSTTSWATSFKWNFGDMTEDGTGQVISHTFTNNGTFKTLFTAGTDDGCSDTASIYVFVRIPVSVFDEMPSVFTPNGDTWNDYYKLKETSLSGINTLDCWIYSRWGKQVAEWHSIQDAINGWDGSINGGPKASPGVYYYYIKAVGYDGAVYEKKGAIHLFR